MTNDDRPCPTCDGYGMVNSDGTQPGSPPGPNATVRKCSSCDGTGTLPGSSR